MLQDVLWRMVERIQDDRDFTALDMTALVEAALGRMGWDLLDPDVVARRAPSPEEVSLLLSRTGAPHLLVRVTAVGSDPAEVLRAAATAGAPWAAIVESGRWRLWRCGDSGASGDTPAFRDIFLADAEAAARIEESFGAEAHADGRLDAAWAEASLGSVLLVALRRHLAAAPPAVLGTLRKAARSAGLPADTETVRAALEQLDLQLVPGDELARLRQVAAGIGAGMGPAEGTAPAEQVEETEAVAPAAPRPGPRSRKTAAKRGKAKKPAGKSATRTAARKQAVPKPESSAGEAPATPVEPPATAQTAEEAADTPAVADRDVSETAVDTPAPVAADGATEGSVEPPETTGSETATESGKPEVSQGRRPIGKREASTQEAMAKWPAEATHYMIRNDHIAYLSHDPKSGATVILPGSTMRARTGASFSKYHQGLREKAITEGKIVPDGRILRVVAPLQIDAPGTAATMIGGTVSNAYESWKDRNGDPIARAPRKKGGTLSLKFDTSSSDSRSSRRNTAA